MGLCISSQGRAEKIRSSIIDRSIQADGLRLKGEYKILLLGSGESGKSTVFKQMKILYQGGYKKEELVNWRAIVYRNLIQSAQAFVKALDEFGYQPSSEKSQHEAQLILNYRLLDKLDSDITSAITSIWKAPDAHTLLEERSSEFYLMDSASYFFNEIKRLSHPDYVPNLQDVLRARAKTTGITEARFKIGKTSIHMFDVGGQRSERKKWIHCFEAVKLTIFCISLSEYDQVLLEESRQNRMMESLVLFESVVNSQWFQGTSFILFLNKKDIFQEKLKKIPMKNYFPDYEGGLDLNKAVKYILWRFQQVNRAKLNVFPHLTQATDTKSIGVIFKVVEHTLIETHLKDSGVI